MTLEDSNPAGKVFDEEMRKHAASIDRVKEEEIHQMAIYPGSSLRRHVSRIRQASGGKSHPSVNRLSGGTRRPCTR